MELLKSIDWVHIAYALSLFIIGYWLAHWVSKLIAGGLNRYLSKHQTMIAKRLLFYVLFLIFTISALQQLGFKLSVILGAAGIFTVALSFASQTAASNLISGIFLLFERPFKVGDQVEINGTTGTIEAIDLLSTKIRSGDNILIRIPNETLIKSQINNLNYYKTRRADLLINVSYDADINKMKELLLKIAKEHPLALPTPEPVLTLDSFGDSAVSLRLQVWTKSDQVSTLNNELRELILQTFSKEGIAMPYPRLNIYQTAQEKTTVKEEL